MYPTAPIPERDVCRVAITQISLRGILSWIAWQTQFRYLERARTICLVNAYSVVEANRNPRHMEALKNADGCLADGLGVALLAKTPKIAGADLMLAAARHPELGKMRHVLLGGFGVAFKAAIRQFEEAKAQKICALREPRIPETLTDGDLLEWANSVPCDILWIALGCPKQEIWMQENRHRLKAKVVIAVGAAFDFLAGRIPRAPGWMQGSGLEAFYRIWAEPTRWRRQAGAMLGFLRLLATYRNR